MKIVDNKTLPTPNGHYSNAVVHGGLLYISGQLPIDPVTRTPPEGFDRQARLVLKRLADILAAAGTSMHNVLQVRIYLSDVNDWGAMNEHFAACFGAHRPARVIVPVPELHYGCRLELEATAVIDPET
ncbi:MAG: RidA family protein [Haliea sp.]|uniref:RidA family protein n=1 Tax=Haliea sp. TaxID=1932666 RepID=UPI0032EDC4CA